MRRIAIVGASLAGLRAAEALREAGYLGELTLIGAERHAPYDRPPLSKQLLTGEIDIAELTLPSERDLDARWLLGRAAAGLRVHPGEVALDDGTTVPFDGLLVATGAKPRRLPDHRALPGLHVLRTRDDSLSLRDALRHRPARVVMIGGGFIGSELASVARELGLAATIIDAGTLPLTRPLGITMARWVMALHQRHNVRLSYGAAVAAVEGRRKVEAVRLADGERVPADLVVVALGSKPNTDWLAGSGLKLDDGLVCTPTLRAVGTSTIVAAGDVVRWPHPLFDGELTRVEHWSNAVDQARVAARNLLTGLGAAVPFAQVPLFTARVHGLNIRTMGLGYLADESRVITGDPCGEQFIIAFGRKGRFIGGVAVNESRRLEALRPLVGARQKLADLPALPMEANRYRERQCATPGPEG